MQVEVIRAVCSTARKLQTHPYGVWVPIYTASHLDFSRVL